MLERTVLCHPVTHRAILPFFCPLVAVLYYSLGMLYQRKISRDDSLGAKLAFQLQTARFAGVGAQVLAVAAVASLLRYQSLPVSLPVWCGAMLMLALGQSLHMVWALCKQHHLTRPVSLVRQLAFSALLGGSAWSASIVLFSQFVSDDLLLALVTVLVIASVAPIVVTSVIAEFYLVWSCTALIPLATWFAWHYDARPFNPLLVGLLSGLPLLLATLSVGSRRTFGEMLDSSLEREAMAQDMAGLTESLRAKNVQLQEARKQLADLAKLDELTGLRNRRGADQVFYMELSRAQRLGTPLAVVMVDVDHFKAYNDTYGHPAGDVVLKDIAAVLRSVTSRAGDLAIRMGGEEFLLLLPGTGEADAMATAEKARRRIMELSIEHKASSTEGVVTVSQGVVAGTPAMATTFAELHAAADKALYASKESGRNSITLAAFRT